METADRQLLQRVRMEYVEMPGLSLTVKQASRLWNLDITLCDRLLRELVREQFLAQAPAGAFLRRDGTV
jgi:hypothetical protein